MVNPRDLTVSRAELETETGKRKKAEKELRQYAAQVEQKVEKRTVELRGASLYARSLIEASLDPLVIISPEGKITDVNGATEEATGLARERLIGTDFSDYFTKPEKARQGYREVFSRGLVRDYPLTIRHASGGTIDVLFNATVYKDEAGEVQGIFAAARDITERKQAEEELQQKNAELERFAYTVSHDLKSPLVTIKAFLGYLKKDISGADAGRIEKDMLYMSGAADKMGNLLDELLAISRIGRVTNPPVTVTFHELVQETLDLVAGRIEERGVKMKVSAGPITLYGDRPRLVEIWQNLVENAVKFMGDQPAPHIEIGAEKRNGNTVFLVRDNGMGIDPKYRSKLFNLFEKLDPRSEGTGMGLAITKRIVELYKGTIWLESKGLGKGACFRFTLPAALEKSKGEKV